jgi:uncharacterized protein (DUF1800 family)
MRSSVSHALVVPLALFIAACGGGSGGGGGGGGGGVTPSPVTQSPTAAEAARFLTQATFGPTDASIDALQTSTFDAWVTQQINTPPPAETHLEYLDAALVRAQSSNPPGFFAPMHFYQSWWREVLTEDGQLRQRVAFAYSQIFVVSLSDATIGGGPPGIRGAGAYYDMLLENAFGNYRTLIEQITLHPVMGTYLTHVGNQAEDPAGTRTPDENYAREIMQLMSIGLFELNIDGSVRRNAQGDPIPTYTQADISNLARVFTGFSWYNPSPSNLSFSFGGSMHADSFVRPMLFYPQFHSTSQKSFLGVTIPATSSATQQTMTNELRTALDAIANHPNVGPFISTRLIQQLVTSNPSPAYVERVARVFNNNGQGVRGDMGAVVRAILLDPEARDMANSGSATFGKLREPVIRMANFLRAFRATSTSGFWLIQNTSSNQSLGQSPLNSPSVFNFWRPGFVPPGTTQAGSRGMWAPEFQAADEVTIAGYVNTMFNAVNDGFGAPAAGVPDVRPSYAAEIAIASDAGALADRMNRLLFYGAMPPTLRTRIVDAAASIVVPSGSGVTQAQIDAALLARVRTAVLLSVASPDYLIQR